MLIRLVVCLLSLHSEDFDATVRHGVDQGHQSFLLYVRPRLMTAEVRADTELCCFPFWYISLDIIDHTFLIGFKFGERAGQSITFYALLSEEVRRHRRSMDGRVFLLI